MACVMFRNAHRYSLCKSPVCIIEHKCIGYARNTCSQLVTNICHFQFSKHYIIYKMNYWMKYATVSSDTDVEIHVWYRESRDKLTRNCWTNHRSFDFCLTASVDSHQRHIKVCISGLYVGNSSVTGELPAQRASNAEKVSIWWRHHPLWDVRVFFPINLIKW